MSEFFLEVILDVPDTAIRQRQQTPYRNQIAPPWIGIGERDKDQRAQQGLRRLRPVAVLFRMRDERLGEHRGVLDHVLVVDIELSQGIERDGTFPPLPLAADVEGIEDIDVLAKTGAVFPCSFASTACRNRRVFALRIDDKSRALVQNQVRHDQRHALAGAAARNRQHMPVVIPADQAALAATKQQSLSAVFPGFSGYFLGAEPARRQGALASERFLRRKTAREFGLEPCFKIVVRQNASTFFHVLNDAILFENGAF